MSREWLKKKIQNEKTAVKNGGKKTTRPKRNKRL